MNEAFDREMERQNRKLGDEIFESKKPRSVNDIMALIASLSNRTRSMAVPIKTTLIGTDDNDKQREYSVSGVTQDQSRRDILVSFFTMIRERITASMKTDNTDMMLVNGRVVRRAPVINTDGRLPIDNLIDRWLGGKRDGLFIVWNVSDVVYKYDVLDNRLFKET